MTRKKLNQEGSDQSKDVAEQMVERISSDDPEAYTTDLDYISTWDVIHYQPSDSFINGVEQLFEDGAFDPGENYPRGV